MPVFAVPEALQTEERNCSEILKDADRASEGKCTVGVSVSQETKFVVSYSHLRSALMFFLPEERKSYYLGSFK